ncbi:hypothetical protein T484DRAFT_1968600 [Baffinella frigidus]|nr:hypothetical protein T484DRAFT_1968600 [Cryptophyta sp. CCMP2293]
MPLEPRYPHPHRSPCLLNPIRAHDGWLQGKEPCTHPPTLTVWANRGKWLQKSP